MSRVGEVLRFRKGIEHPKKPTLVGDNDIRVFVVSQKRSDAVDDLANVAIDHHTAVTRHAVGEWQLGKISDAPGEQHASQTIADGNAACALVGRGRVGLALRKVKLVLLRFYVNVAVRELAEIDLRTSDFDLRGSRLNRHV